MAIENVSQTSARETYNRIANKTRQLHAMLEMTYGGARETFDSMNDDLRDNYLWACAEQARECQELVDALPYPAAGEVSHG